MEEVSQVTSDELKYKTSNSLHTKQKFQQLQPFSGNQPKSVTSGGDEIVFQLPAGKVMNFGKSILEFLVTPAATAGANTHYVKYAKPLTPIRQIELYTQSGVYLCQLYNVNKYLDVVFYPETELSDFLDLEESINTGGSKSTQTHSSNYAADQVVATAVYTAGPPVSFTSTSNKQNKLININAAGTYNDVSEGVAYRNYTEKLYYQTSSADDVANPIMKISFPLKYLYNTILALDKNLFYGEILNLRIILDDAKNVMYKVTVNPTDLTRIVPANVGDMAAPGTLTISDFYLYLAVENDLAIAQQIIERVTTQGMTVNIPYVYTYKSNYASGTNQSLSLRFNRGHGKKLRKIYHTICHGREELVYNYIRDNVGGTKTVDYYYTLLNNDRIQEYNIKCSEYKDWQLHRHKLKGSSIQSVREYQYGWFHCEDFTGEHPLCSKASHDYTLSSGVDLSAEQKYDIYVTLNNDRSAVGGITHYDFVITEKDLIIRPGQIIVS